MAARGPGLSRALGASPCPAWRRAHWGAKGRLKPEYDAVVIGAGNRAVRKLRGGEGSPALSPGDGGRGIPMPHTSLCSGHKLVWIWARAGVVVENLLSL